MKLDMHNHTTYSDSTATPAELIAMAKKIGIVPFITDHDTMAALKDAKEASRKLDWPFVIGEEIRTEKGEISGLMLNEEIPKGLSPEETLDRINEQGAISYVTHPYSMTRSGLGGCEKAMKMCDIIEVLNPRSSFISDDKARRFAQKNGKLMGAGSDSHWLEALGGAYVETEEMDLDSPKSLLKAVSSGKPVLISRVNKLERTFRRLIKKAKKILRKYRNDVPDRGKGL
jgi:hypothetical protein